jgi:hypothetical protein
LPGHETLEVQISVVDLPAFRIIAEALYEISHLRDEECALAPEIAVRAAHDAVAIVRERNP